MAAVGPCFRSLLQITLIPFVVIIRTYAVVPKVVLSFCRFGFWALRAQKPKQNIVKYPAAVYPELDEGQAINGVEQGTA
jgi:hypothetical protein